MSLSIIALFLAFFGFHPAHHHGATPVPAPIVQPMDGGGVLPAK